MRIPTKSQRLAMLHTVEKNCKSKGAYLKPQVKDYNLFLNKVYRTYPAYRKTIENCISSTKNILMEIVKWSHVNNKINNAIQLKWFKSFINTIVSSIKSGLNIALGYIKNYIKAATRSLFDTAAATVITPVIVTYITSSVVIGLISAVVILGIGLWMNSAERKISRARLSSGPSRWNKIQDKIKGIFGSDGVEIPEELLPPDPQAPNITATFVKESASGMLGGFIFMVFLKAVIVNRFNEELKEKISIMSSLFTPTNALIGLLTTLLVIGSGGISAIV